MSTSRPFESVCIIIALFLSTSPFILFGVDADAQAATLYIRQLMWVAVYLPFTGLSLLSPGVLGFALKHGKVLLGLTALTTLSCLWSEMLMQTLSSSAALWCSTLIAVYAAYTVPPQRLLALLAIALGLLAIGSIAVILLLPDYGIMSGIHEGLWNGLSTHKNALGRYMMIGLITSIALLRLPNARYKPLLIVMAALCFILMLGAESATAYILLAAFSLLFLLLRTDKNLKGPARIGMLCTLFTAVVVVTIFFSDMSNFESALNAIGRDATLTHRTRIWEAAFDAIREQPWLGYGYEAFWDSNRGANFALRYTTWAVPHVHNGFLEIWLELGIPGLLLLFILLLQLVRHLARRLEPALLVLFCLTLTATIVLNMAEVNLLRYNNIFWLMSVYTLMRLKAEPRTV